MIRHLTIAFEISDRQALVFFMMIALTTYYLLQRIYRQSVPPDATDKQRLTTAETICRNHPSNVFVAGFIGSPSMNFFDAKVDKSNGKFIVNTDHFQVVVPDDRASSCAPHEGKRVVFGIRPEDVHDPVFAPPGILAAEVEANVDVTELMGNEIFVHLSSGQSEFTGRIDPRTSFKTGEKAQVVFNMHNMHLFETEGDQKAI